MNKALLSVQNVSVSHGGKCVLSDVSLDIHHGKITTLVGPSGCGKTSLLMSLNRLTDLIDGCAVTGSVMLGDEELLGSEIDTVTLRRRIGMIFQKPNPFPFSVRRNIELPLQEHGVKDAKERDALMEQSLRDVGLWSEVSDRLGASALSLSGGQQQRLCIARTLALRPEVLLLDEPCSALDPLSSGVVEDLILSLRESHGLVVVTHNLAQARRIADEVAFFWAEDGVGQLLERGTAEQVFQEPRHATTKAYINGIRG